MSLLRSLGLACSALVVSTMLVACASETPEETAPAARPEVIGDSSEEQVGWSCNGLTSSKKPTDGRYYITSFGCWTDRYGNDRGDGADNCHPSCEAEARDLCGNGVGWDDCERKIRWFTADADRFGCGAKLKVTNPTNGKSVIVAAIDRGPNCSVEKKVQHAVLDLSYEASIYLYGEEKSAKEKAAVVVESVGASTTLGPVSGKAPATEEDAPQDELGCPVLTYPSGVSLQTKKDSALTASYASFTSTPPTCFLDVDDLRDPQKNVRYATNVRLATNFRLAEIAGSALGSSRRVLIDPAFVSRLQALRDVVGPVTIEAGYLTPKQAGGLTPQSSGKGAVVSSGADQQDAIDAAGSAGLTASAADNGNVSVSLAP
jgi:hypothetical protein